MAERREMIQKHSPRESRVILREAGSRNAAFSLFALLLMLLGSGLQSSPGLFSLAGSQEVLIELFLFHGAGYFVG